MKGDKTIKIAKKQRNLSLFRGRRWIRNIHFRNHFETNRIDSCFGRHFHRSVVKFCCKEIIKISSRNIFEINHFIATLMKIEFPIHIVEDLANVSVSNRYYGFAIIQIFIAFDWNVRAYEKRIFPIISLVLCIAFSRPNATEFFRRTLFPRIRNEPRKLP